jgi:hypothetical protein
MENDELSNLCCQRSTTTSALINVMRWNAIGKYLPI